MLIRNKIADNLIDYPEIWFFLLTIGMIIVNLRLEKNILLFYQNIISWNILNPSFFVAFFFCRAML